MTVASPVERGQDSGSTRALAASTVAFTVCFAIWTIFSIIGVRIKDELQLSETAFGLLVGTPILTGSLVRIGLGIWADRAGGRLVYALTMMAAAVATFLLAWAHTYTQMLIAALGVGLAGGSFAVGVAYVSRFFPSERQGTALGVFGIGNVGAAVTKFLAPLLLLACGWQAVAQIWAVALLVTAIVFWFATEDDPVARERRAGRARPKSLSEEFAPLRNAQVWRFALYYFFVFGGFGGFVLPIALGLLNDPTGLWTSCFMLLFLIVALSLVWMHLAIRRIERAGAATSGEALTFA